MSIFDVDSINMDRGTPRPATHDVMPMRPNHGTLSTSIDAGANPNNHTRVVFKNNMILYYDDTGRVIRVDGFIPSVANYPLTIIAQYGYDVFVDILGITAP